MVCYYLKQLIQADPTALLFQGYSFLIQSYRLLSASCGVSPPFFIASLFV